MGGNKGKQTLADFVYPDVAGDKCNYCDENKRFFLPFLVSF